jgi:hypothetical protein
MRSLRLHGAALVLFSALTVLLAFPVVSQLGSAVPGWEGDNLQFVRSVWWVEHALLDLHIAPFFDPTSFHPVGEHIARSEMTPVNTFLAVPITALWNAQAAYSVMILFSFVATAMGAYFWVLQLTGRRSAGIVAGAIAGFLPLRFAHMLGHLPEITTQWVPWTLFAFERFLERRTQGRAAVLGIFVALVALACWYYGHALALMLPVYAVARTWRSRDVWRDPAWWRGIGISVAVAAVLVMPFVIPAARLHAGGELRRRIADMDAWSINPYDFFLPNLWHPLWGAAGRLRFPVQGSMWVERGIVFGYVACAAAVLGLARGQPRRIVRMLFVVWCVSYLIALGPSLHFHDHPVLLPLPTWMVSAADGALGVLGALSGQGQGLRAEIVTTGHTPVFLPSFFLYYLFPLTSSMRTMSRFGLWTNMLTAALAAFGAIVAMDWVSRRRGRTAGHIVAGALVAAVAFESLTVIPMMPLAPRPVDRWLATEPPDAVVVELPVDQATRMFQNYYATVHGRSMVFGWNGDSFPPPEYAARVAALTEFPSPQSVAFLRSIGATHVLVTPSQIPDWPAYDAKLNVPGLRYDRDVGGVRVYRVR